MEEKRDEAYYDRILREADEAAKKRIEEQNKATRDRLDRIKEYKEREEDNEPKFKPVIDQETLKKYRKNMMDDDLDM